MIDEQSFFDQLLKNYLRTYRNVRKIVTSQVDDYTTGCLLHDTYFKELYKMTAIDLIKQQALNANPKAIQQIGFIGNVYRDATMFFIIEKTMFFIIEEVKETVLGHKEV